MEMRTSTKRTIINSFPILLLTLTTLLIASRDVHEIPRSPLSSRLHLQPHEKLQLGRTKFNRDPAFDYIAPGVRGLVEKVRPNLFGPLSDRYPSFYPRGEVAELPGWIAFDKQILCFEAFFKETLQEVRASPFLVRRVKIYFFLEDGTIQVAEPRVDNSGIAQGTLIARQRIRFPAPMDDNFYDVLDLNIGREVEFFGKVFKITNCDKFTRNFLNRSGIAVADPIEIPKDPYLETRKHAADGLLPKKPSRKVDTLKQFLENDRKVLRFYAYWDDRETEYGYIHKLEIYYYLADDTIEMKEIISENSGLDSGFMFLRRQKLPKIYKGLPGPGANSEFTVLNVLGKGRYVADALDCGREDVEIYKECDLTIGGVINCFGRKIVITDCDPFTKQFYNTKYGLEKIIPLEMPKEKEEIKTLKPKDRELPPWNGYGSFEDSAQNCVTVELKPLLKDLRNFLKYDRKGLDSHILRFEARMVSKVPENCGRIFIISYYLADDTIAVFEVGRRNSGFASKQFFARGPVNLPNQATYTSKAPEIYKPQHMFIGASININSFRFVLIDADEYALRYMECHCNEFPKANIKLIMDKVREKLRPIYKDFVAENIPEETPAIAYEKLREKLCRIMGEDFTEHEMITIARAFSATCTKDKYNREDIRALALTELKRQLWDDLDRLKEYFLQRDHARTGKLSRKDCYTLLRACRLPVDVELIERILDVVKKDEKCNLYYNDLLDLLDRSKCPVADAIPINVKYDLYWGSEREIKAGTLIDWCAFNKHLDLEDTFKEIPGPPTIEALQKIKDK